MLRKSTNRDDYQHIARPVGAMAKEFPRGYLSHKHHHDRAQFLYAVSGVLEVSTQYGLWIIPPQRAVWIPPHIDHEVGFKTAASVRTLYVRQDAFPASAPDYPCSVKVSPLLRELILRAVEMPLDYDEHGHDGRLIALMLEEIKWIADKPLHLVIPEDKRLRRIHQGLMDDPSDKRTLDEWAQSVGASSRTLARLFQAEMGVSFLHWRQQVRVLGALPRLAMKEPIINIALDLGYETPSAFAAMFKKHMGILPSLYFEN